MRVVVQRVSDASVRIEDRLVAAIGRGLLVLAGFEEADQADDLQRLAAKLTRLRVFPDERGVMNRSVVDIGGEVLAVSQFTLYAETAKGNRPSWGRAAGAAISQPLFERFLAALADELGRPVAAGVFGADMKVSLTNDGPVTLYLDTRSATPRISPP